MRGHSLGLIVSVLTMLLSCRDAGQATKAVARNEEQTAAVSTTKLDEADYDFGDYPEWDKNPELAPARAACHAVRDHRLPTKDYPDSAARSTLRSCGTGVLDSNPNRLSSEKLYYGIGIAKDPAKARLCAIIEAENMPANVQNGFGGKGLLMIIYANGVGAKQDLDLATHFACTISSAPAEVAGRVQHLEQMRHGDRKPFDYCDDVTSGLAGAECEGHRSLIRNVERDRQFAVMTTHWPGPSTAAFGTLRKAYEEFVDDRVHKEAGLRGTAGAGHETALARRLDDDFQDMIRLLSSGKQPTYGPDAAAAADRRLNAAYRAMRAPKNVQERDLEARNIRDTQRAWLRYRDAFLTFAAIQFPKVTRDSMVGWLSDKRARMLNASIAGLCIPSQCPDQPDRWMWTSDERH